MSYCINPSCTKPSDIANLNKPICRNCGCELLLKGRYQVMRLLSDNSGFGNIYEAYDGSKPKILKVLKEDHNKNHKIVELFQQEAAVLSQLHHPGIPKVKSDGYFQYQLRHSTQVLHCIIMEKIDGPTLKQWMKQQGNHPISEKLALNWLKQLAEILHLVHQKNYFHRDIKPTNIMMRSLGQLVLIDFGTAREMTYTYLADVGGAGRVTKISSAGYTPPEQEKGHAVPQSDFYALGRTFVYLLTGKQATDKDIYEPYNDKCNWHNYASHISPQLADFIDKLMAPTAAARPKNTQELLDSLSNISQGNFGAKNPINLLSGSQSNLIVQQLRPASNKNFKLQEKLLIGGVVSLVIGLGGYALWEIQHLNTSQVLGRIFGYENISTPRTLSGHSGYVNTLVILPDGQTLVSGSADKTIKVWNLVTGKEVGTLTGHSNFVNALAVSSDGQTLVSGSADKTIKVWNLATGKEIRTLTGHSNFVNALVISSDGQTLVSGSADKTIKVWNLATGKEIRTITKNNSYINALVISPDGQTLVGGSADKTIKVWDLTTGQEIHTIIGHSSYVNCLAISPDGQTLVSGSADKTIKVWELSTGKEIRTLTGHTSWVKSLVMSPDGQTLISGAADNTIKVWNLSTGEEIRTLTGHSNHVNSLALSPDGQTIASGSGDKTIKIWRVAK